MKWLQGFLRWFRGPARGAPPPEDERQDRDLPPSGGTRTGTARGPSGRPRAIRVSPEAVHIQVGVDFGTSSTKIAYREIGREVVLPLLFDHGLSWVPAFCLPSLIAFERDTVLLGTEASRALSDAPWSHGVRALKLLLAADTDLAFRSPLLTSALSEYTRRHMPVADMSIEAMTAIYLAYAFRRSREGISSISDYRDQRLDLAFNVSVPLEYVQGNPVRRAFDRALLQAELMEREWPVSSDVAWLLENHSSYSEKTLSENERRAFLVPEAIGQAASYVSSLGRSPGLHGLIDLGAGTTDVSVFNLCEEGGEQRTYWYASGNLPMGALEIERYLSHNQTSERSAREVADLVVALAPAQDDSVMGAIRDHLTAVHTASRRVWAAAYSRLKQEGPWHHVDIFLCGGGSALPHVAETFSTPTWEHLRNQGVRYRVQSLPEPDDYDSLGDQAPFTRMAVAYGLTIPVPLLGEYVLPADCPNHTPPPLPMRPTLGQQDGGHLIPGAGWV